MNIYQKAGKTMECRKSERGEKGQKGGNKNVVKTITATLVLLWTLRW